MGHPWPIVPRLASMPNAPLHSTYARPPDGIRGPRCLSDLLMAERRTKAEQNIAAMGRSYGFVVVGWVERSDIHQADNQPHGYRAAQPILQIKSQLADPPNQSVWARTNAPSAGRVESLWKGVSRMDAARGVKGQGWPLYAGPWSNDGAREPDEVGPDARGKTFCLLLGRLPKVSRRKGGTVSPANT